MNKIILTTESTDIPVIEIEVANSIIVEEVPGGGSLPGTDPPIVGEIDYKVLKNKPMIEGVELIDNKLLADLGYEVVDNQRILELLKL